MPLAPKTRIGPYQILAELGKGGMGEVYRGRDTTLNRDVALKVLPAAFANDAERLARFQREAQTLASISHPNIAAIYGIEEPPAGSGQSSALVLELVDGEDLSTLIARGPIPLTDALAIARQIADALEAAHDQGIVHRDLKPANIKIKADGTVKVLDFGLAKAFAPEGSNAAADAMNSPTLTAAGFGPSTQMGVILGTAAYMSPEQARGRSVDRRADIWAFGVVVYEMLTGKRAFEGDDISVTLANVIKDDVNWVLVPGDVPVSVRRLLRRCLEKDPKKRLSAIGDARIEIDDAAAPPNTIDGPSQPGASATSSRSPRTRTAWIVAGTAAALWIATLAAWFWPRPAPPSTHRMRFEVLSVGDVTGGTLAPQVSPDGRMLAYISPSATGGPARIWIRPLDSTDTRAVASTEGAANLFWAPDSRSIGFATGGKLFRVGVDGGAPLQLCEVGSFGGGTWSVSGDIVFSAGSGSRNGTLFRVRDVGGTATELTKPTSAAAETHMWPSFLPDGRHFLTLSWTSVNTEGGIYVHSIDGGTPRRVGTSTGMAIYGAPGYLLFARGNTLFAQTFDAGTFATSGDPIRVVDGVVVQLATGRASYSISTNGILAYRQAQPMEGASDLTWFDRSGTPGAAVGGPRNYQQIRLSPDGRRVAFSEVDPTTYNYTVSVLDLGNGIATPLTNRSAYANDPVWGPDSQSVAYEAVHDRGGRQLYTHRVGNKDAVLAFESPDDPKWIDDWSADGKFLLFHLPRPSKLFAVTIGADGRAGAPNTLFDTTETIDGAHFSPDGKWIVYLLTEAGVYQVWIASFPAFDRRQRVSPAGGGQAIWRQDGQELFYLTPTGKLMSVRVTARGESLDVDAPVELFQSPFSAPILSIDSYTVSKDGQRFLFTRPKTTTSVKAPITVVVNWAAGLGRQ